MYGQRCHDKHNLFSLTETCNCRYCTRRRNLRLTQAEAGWCADKIYYLIGTFSHDNGQKCIHVGLVQFLPSYVYVKICVAKQEFSRNMCVSINPSIVRRSASFVFTCVSNVCKKNQRPAYPPYTSGLSRYWGSLNIKSYIGWHFAGQ